MILYAIVGTGGFGREIMPLAKIMLESQLEENTAELVFVNENIIDSVYCNNYKVISKADFLSHPAKTKYFNIAIANYEIRKKIAEELLALGLNSFNIIAHNATILDNNNIASGAILCNNTIITSNANIGKFFHANIYSYIAHDCIIGDYVTFAPSVHCNGLVVIENYAYLGTGAIIRQGSKERPIVIGEGAIVGMGAVITKSVPAYTTVVGNPAREFVS